MKKKDYTNSRETLRCCGHMAMRHMLIGGTGAAGAEGEYICITGFCTCGLVKVKPQKRERSSRSSVHGPVAALVD